MTSLLDVHVLLCIHKSAHVFWPDIRLLSGCVAASDPFVDYYPKPFTFEIEPGSYQVELAIGHFGTDQRVAFARICFAPGQAATWLMATTNGQDASTIGPTEVFGYGVDSGTGCFMSPEAGELLDARMDKEPDYFENIIEAMEKTYRHTWSWADIRPEDNRNPNIIAFSSGFGDGFYASYIGLDREGKIICLVTDFGTLNDPTSD